MNKNQHQKGSRLPLIIETRIWGSVHVECPVFEGCYSQGKTLDEAIANIREVISLVLEEKENQETLSVYQPQELSLHTITIYNNILKNVRMLFLWCQLLNHYEKFDKPLLT